MPQWRIVNGCLLYVLPIWYYAISIAILRLAGGRNTPNNQKPPQRPPVLADCFIAENRTLASLLWLFKIKMYRSGSQNGSRREMGHSAPTWAMHGKRQISMHGPADLTQIEKKCASLFSNENFKLKLA